MQGVNMEVFNIKDKIADALDKIHYDDIELRPSHYVKKVIGEAKTGGCVVAYGASDDTLRLVGYIDESVGAFEGGEAWIYKMKMLETPADNVCHDCDIFREVLKRAIRIRAEWKDFPKSGQYTWELSATVPYKSFTIERDDMKNFCMGIVIDLNEAEDYIDCEIARKMRLESTGNIEE